MSKHRNNRVKVGVIDRTPAATAGPQPADSANTPFIVPPGYFRIGLPSDGKLDYPFSVLAVKPPTVGTVGMFNTAHAQSNDRVMIDAISSLLISDVGPVNAGFLAVQDFVWLQYYIRRAFYVKHQMVASLICTDTNHLSKVQAGELSAGTLTNIVTITQTSLKEILLTASPEVKTLSNGWTTGPALMWDVAESADLLDAVPENDEEVRYSEEIEEISYYADLASFIRSPEGHTPLSDRIEVLKGLSLDDLSLISEYRNEASQFGVVESVKFTCKECRAAMEAPVSIAARDFL